MHIESVLTCPHCYHQSAADRRLPVLPRLQRVRHQAEATAGRLLRFALMVPYRARRFRRETVVLDAGVMLSHPVGGHAVSHAGKHCWVTWLANNHPETGRNIDEDADSNRPSRSC